MALNDGFLRLDVVGHAGDGAARAHAGDENVHLAVGVVPDLGAGGGQVNGRVGRVVELLQDVAVGRLFQDLVGLGDGALHAVGAGGEHDLRAVGEQRHAPLQAHGLRHGEDDLVALDRGHKRQRDAGVAAGGLNQHGLAGRDFAGLLGGVDHGEADAVFHARCGVLAFQLGDHGAGSPAATRFSRTSGVWPINSVTFAAMRAMMISFFPGPWARTSM